MVPNIANVAIFEVNKRTKKKPVKGDGCLTVKDVSVQYNAITLKSAMTHAMIARHMFIPYPSLVTSMVIVSRLRRETYFLPNSRLSVEVDERMTLVRDTGKCTMSPISIFFNVALIGIFNE